MRKRTGNVNLFIRLLSSLFAALLVIGLPLSIISNNSLQVLFSPDEISESVASLLLLRGGVREKLSDTLVSDAWSDQAPANQGTAIKLLTAQDRLKIAQLLFTKEWVDNQVQENLEKVILWIETDEPLPELFIDLGSLRGNLQQGASRRIAEIAVDSWPLCSDQQERQLDLSLQRDSAARFEFCKPQSDLYQRLVDYADQRLQQYIENMPDTIPLFDQINPVDEGSILDEFRVGMLRLLLVLNWLRTFQFLFLGLIMTLAIRSWRDLGQWWGIPLVIGAVLTLLLIILGHAIGPGILINSISQTVRIPEIQEPIVNAIWDVIAAIFNRSTFQALFSGLIGAVLFILGQRSKKNFPIQLQPASIEDVHAEALEEISPPPQVEIFDPDTLQSSNEEEA